MPWITKPNISASILLSCLLLQACGSPVDSQSLTAAKSVSGLSVPLRRRSRAIDRNVTEHGLLMHKQRNAVIAKYYSSQSAQKRSTGYDLIIDQNYDSGYIGSLAIGTPLASFDVLLDTGSADLWLVSSACGQSCSKFATYDPSSSSSFKNLSSPFSIQYGGGEATGYIAQDEVELAGFSISDQGFAVVEAISSNLILPPTSGFMGLAWQPLSVSQQTPFWQSLASSGAFSSLLFAFQLRRYSNVSDALDLEPGGELTFGYTNSSLYTGSIDYINIPGTPSFWFLPLESLTIQGNSIPITNGTTAVIDTGTTNIGGPTDAIQAIYAQINGSSPASELPGYFQYPCSTSVTVEISFGGRTWTMSPTDFQVTQINPTECIGAFFETGSPNQGNSSASMWVIGDAFLKNVYSVFRYDPPSVGFAALSEVAIAQNGVNGPVPSATTGSSVASVTDMSDAMSRVQFTERRAFAMGCAVVGAITAMSWVL